MVRFDQNTSFYYMVHRFPHVSSKRASHHVSKNVKYIVHLFYNLYIVKHFLHSLHTFSWKCMWFLFPPPQFSAFCSVVWHIWRLCVGASWKTIIIPAIKEHVQGPWSLVVYLVYTTQYSLALWAWCWQIVPSLLNKCAPSFIGWLDCSVPWCPH